MWCFGICVEQLHPQHLIHVIEVLDLSATPSYDYYVAGLHCQPLSRSGLRQLLVDTLGRGDICIICQSTWAPTARALPPLNFLLGLRTSHSTKLSPRFSMHDGRAKAQQGEPTTMSPSRIFTAAKGTSTAGSGSIVSAWHRIL